MVVVMVKVMLLLLMLRHGCIHVAHFVLCVLDAHSTAVRGEEDVAVEGAHGVRC